MLTAVWISQEVIVVFVREDLTWPQTKNTAEVSMTKHPKTDRLLRSLYFSKWNSTKKVWKFKDMFISGLASWVVIVDEIILMSWNDLVFSFHLILWYPWFYFIISVWLYSLSSFVDINECRENSRLCPFVCKNFIGGYRCRCPPGFRGDGQNCQGTLT